jgi:hypothetical protein
MRSRSRITAAVASDAFERVAAEQKPTQGTIVSYTCHPPRRTEGFVFIQMLAVLMVGAALAGVMGYTFLSMTRSGTAVQSLVSNKRLLAQAAFTLAAEGKDSDGDTFWEAPAGIASALNGDGWDVPATSAAPKADDLGTKFRYCAWKNKTATAAPATGVDAATSTAATSGRLIGDLATASPSSITLAVISAGVDKVFQTTCADAKAKTLKGDDDMRVMNSSQLAQGINTGMADVGSPVADLTELYALPTAVIKAGQVRVVRCNDTAAGCAASQKPGAAYLNKTGVTGQVNWVLNSGSGGVATADDYAAVLALSGVDGDLVVAKDTGAVYYMNTAGTPKWQYITTSSYGGRFTATTPAAGPVAVSVLGDNPLPSKTIVTILGGPAYTVGTPVAVGSAPPWPPLNFAGAMATTSITNDTFKVNSVGNVQTAAWGPFTYEVTISDGISTLASSPFRFSLEIVEWAVSSGFALTSGGTMNVAGPFLGLGTTLLATPQAGERTEADCAALPGSLDAWAWVPAMNIPTVGGGSSAQSLLRVPPFCVMRFPAIQGTAGNSTKAVPATSASTATPWVNISWNTLTAASNPCNTMTGVTNASLMKESQWLAIAHNMVGVPANWVDGVVDSAGGMYQGLRDGSVAVAQPATYVPSGSQRREKFLSRGGVTVFDIGGHLVQWTFNDLPGNNSALFDAPLPLVHVAAPYNLGTMGMGAYLPANYPLSGNSPGYAAMRSGQWALDNGDGPFLFLTDVPSRAGADIGFRCTL